MPLFAMVSVKQLFFPIVVVAAILVTVQGELNSFKVNDYELYYSLSYWPNQARLMQLQGEALFVWYAKD